MNAEPETTKKSGTPLTATHITWTHSCSKMGPAKKRRGGQGVAERDGERRHSGVSIERRRAAGARRTSREGISTPLRLERDLRTMLDSACRLAALALASYWPRQAPAADTAASTADSENATVSSPITWAIGFQRRPRPNVGTVGARRAGRDTTRAAGKRSSAREEGRRNADVFVVTTPITPGVFAWRRRSRAEAGDDARAATVTEGHDPGIARQPIGISELLSGVRTNAGHPSSRASPVLAAFIYGCSGGDRAGIRAEDGVREDDRVLLPASGDEPRFRGGNNSSLEDRLSVSR
jgi:hypothetical protein